MPQKISIVIPAFNEVETVGQVVSAVIDKPAVDEVIVVDNASGDGTGAAAKAAGARVVHEAAPGMGSALRAGFMAARNDWVAKIDADLALFNPNLFALMADAVTQNVGLVKGNWQDLDDDMPMTRLLIKPAIRIIVPELSHLEAPNSGIYLFNRSLIDLPSLEPGIAADIDVMLRIHDAGYHVAEVAVGEIKNDPRNTKHYNDMAERILRFFVEYYARKAKQ